MATGSVTVPVRIHCRDLPDPAACGGHLLLGTQCRRDPDQVVEVEAGADATFELEIGVIDFGGAVDFRGPHVQGRKGERFLYLTWGAGPGGGEDPADDFGMFRRAKLMLGDLTDADVRSLLDGDKQLDVTVQGTDAHGHPACARQRHPDIVWAVHPA